MKVRVHGEARAELEAAAEWYERRREDLGADLLAEADQALVKIAEHPEAWPRVRSLRRTDVRQFVMSRFPMLVVYAVRESELLVVAFAHASRQPGYWLRRL